MAENGLKDFMRNFSSEIANARAVIDKNIRMQCVNHGVELNAGDSQRMSEFEREIQRYSGHLPKDKNDGWSVRLMMSGIPTVDVYDMRTTRFEYRFAGDQVVIKEGQREFTVPQGSLLTGRLNSVLNAEVLNPDDVDQRDKAKWIVWQIPINVEGKPVEKSLLVMNRKQEVKFTTALKDKYS